MSSIDNAKQKIVGGLVPLAFALSLPAAALAAPPAPAAQYGFNTNTYSSNFTAQTVDMNRTLNRGYKWYLADLYNRQADPAGVKINSDGSVSLLGDKTLAAGELTTMAPYRGTNSFVGTAFGGGFYMEAVFNFNYAQVASTHPNGVHLTTPAFWALPMEAIVFPGQNQWPGQATGYVHNVEFDFFEADYWTKPIAYGMGLHDWYGIPNKTCSGLCSVAFQNPSGERDAPAGTNYTQYHTYGTLWVPATSTSSGRVDAYFDGVLVGHERTWTQYTNQAPTPVNQTWAFGRLDQQHMFFILGTGVGQSFNIKSVTVWQKDGSKNLVN